MLLLDPLTVGATAARHGRSPFPPLAAAKRGHALPGYFGGGAALARRGHTPSALPSAGRVLLPAPRRRGDGGEVRPLYPRFSGGVAAALLSAPRPLLRGALLHVWSSISCPSSSSTLPLSASAARSRSSAAA